MEENSRKIEGLSPRSLGSLRLSDSTCPRYCVPMRPALGRRPYRNLVLGLSLKLTLFMHFSLRSVDNCLKVRHGGVLAMQHLRYGRIGLEQRSPFVGAISVESILVNWNEELISFEVPSLPSKFYRHTT